MTSYAIQAGALRANPNSGPDGVGVQADIAYTLEARAEVQAVASISNKAVEARAKEPSGGQVNIPDNDNRPIAVASNSAVKNGTRFLSVCSGIEAASQAWPQWDAVAFSEIEKFPSAVLAHHYPDVPNLGDFTKIDTTKLGRVDVLAGGTPCQAFSVAGKRGGLDDARGNLTLSFVELAHDLADGNGLRNVVWENVVGVLSDKGNAFGCFLAGLVGADAAIEPVKRWTNAGMVSGPKGRAAWRILDAQYFGLAQRRRRVIVIADFGIGADPAAVLFVEQGLQWNSPPSREAGEGVTGAAKGGVGGGGWPADVASTLDTAFGPKQGLDDQHINAGAPYFVPQAVSVTGQIAHTLKAEGADASEDGTGRGTPIVAFQSKASASQSMNPSDVAPALDVGKSDGIAICFTAKDYGGDAAYDVSPTLRAGGHSGSHANAGVMPAVAFAQNQLGEVRTSEVMGTLNTNSNASGRSTPMALHASAVRRLTPVECERLQGFPDNYTLIPVRKVSKANQQKAIEAIRNGDEGYKIIDGEAWVMSPDGPRYKALGNSWAVPLFAWLGRRIDKHMPPVAALAHNDNKDRHLDAA